MEKKSFKAWLYLLPAILFLGFFLVYPLIEDVYKRQQHRRHPQLLRSL